MTPTLTFTCSICGEPSTSICVYCTKDACANHICDKCKRCSDCCNCEIHLDEHPNVDRRQTEVAAPSVPIGEVTEIGHTPLPPSPHDDAPGLLPVVYEPIAEPAAHPNDTEPHE